MIDGRSTRIPILNMKLLGSYSVADTIRAVKDDVSAKAVVIRIESPGGSSMAADVMWREIDRLAKTKPVIVSMGSVAASGGYYVASPAREIFALPLTVTGSIGVFYGKADLSGLLAKVGVGFDTYRTTPRADAESLYRPFTEDEKQALAVKIRQFYDTFLDRVSTGRKMSKEQVDAVGQGRVWTGEEAFDRKLVDKLGGLREALAEARKLAKLPDDAPFEELPAVSHTLIDTALGMLGIPGLGQSEILGSIPEPIKELARGVAPVAIYGSDIPLSRIEWVGTESP